MKTCIPSSTLVASVGLLLAALTPSTAAALTCVSNQTFVFKNTISEVREAWVYSGGGRPRLTNTTRYDFSAGTGILVATTCKSGSNWVLMSPVQITNTYQNLAAKDANHFVMTRTGFGVRGWAMPIMRVSTSSVTVKPLECRQVSSLWGLGAQILGMPIPVRTSVAVGAWLASQLGPEPGTRCIAYDAPSVPVSISSTGLIRLPGSVSQTHYLGSQNLVDMQIVSKRISSIAISKR
jgi:hypothetical protein